MTLIRNKKFKTLVNSIANYTQEKYLGMGNPDSKILLVGSEKALSPTHEEDMIIRNHELLNNHYQWYDIINHYNYLTDNFDSVILKRGHAFNPFNPLLLALIANRVRGKSGHTYYGMQRLINAYQALNYDPDLRIFSPAFHQNTFSKIFITELSIKTARNQKAANFNLDEFLRSERYSFLIENMTYQFFSTFKTIILYFGKNIRYIGNPETAKRLQIINIFNRSLYHSNRTIYRHEQKTIEVYQGLKGPKIVLCRHLSAGFGMNEALLTAHHF